MALFQDEIAENDKQNGVEFDDPISKKYGKELQKIYADREKRYNEEVEKTRNYYKNFYSDEKRKEWENKGQMSFMEVWQKADKWSLIPYAGTAKQAYEAFSLKNTADKIRKGTVLSADEKKEFDDYLADIGEMQVRGFTFGGRALDMTLQTIPFMAEFAVGALTTGGGASFLSAAAKAGTKSALRNISLGAAEEIAKNGIAKTVAKGAAKTALNTINPKTYAFSLTRLPQQVALRMGEQQLHDSIAITPEGQLILQEAKDKPATAFFKALQLVNIETASEFSGDMLVRPALYGLGKLASPILKQLPEGLLTNFKKAAEKALNIPFTKALDRYGFNGILEEMGEERVGDVLKYMFNLDDKEGYDFKQLLNAVFPNPDDLLAEFISFGIAGAGMHAVARGAERCVNDNVSGADSANCFASGAGGNQFPLPLPRHPLRNTDSVAGEFTGKDYTADDFLVDSGIIRAAGEQSLVDSAVEKQLIKQGKSDEEINEILRYADNNMKKNFLADQEKYNRAETVEEVKNIIKHIYKSDDANITASGFEDKKLDKISSVLAAVIDVQARKTGKSIEETAETYLPSIAQLKGYVYADENGNGITGEDIQNAIDKLKQNLGELHENEPENMETMDKILSDIGILDDMLNGNLPDEHQQRALDLIMGGKQETDNAEVHHQSAAMKRNLFDDFKDFYNDVLAKPKNTDDKRQFNAKTKDGLYLRIPHDVILHEHGKHKLTIDEWKDLLENIDNVSISIRSRQKSRFSGKAVLLKIKTSNNTFGVVIEAFQRKNPIIATTFTDTEKNVDHWIKEEAIPSGTKTSFLGNRLYNIITSLQPKYKPFNPNVKKSEGNTYFQPADMYSNNANNMFNPALNLPVDNNDFNLKLKKIQNPSANMKNLLTQGYYPEEYIVSTFPGNTKDGKKIKQALEENKEYKKNYQLKYEYEGAKSYWSEKDNKLVDSELVYFDTKEKLEKFLEKIKKDKNFKRVMSIEEVDEWHHVNRSGKNKLINIQKLQDLGFKIDTKNANKEFKVDNNIYYQGVNENSLPHVMIVDLTNEFEKTPTLQEVKDYINKIVEEGTKFATLSPDWFVDVKGGAKKKAHIIKSSNYSKMNKSQKNRHNKYVMSLEKLLAGAEYLGEKENTKKDKNPNAAKYHYFKTTAKIGNKTYEIIFDTEEYVNDNPQTAVKSDTEEYINEKSSSSANVLRSVKNLDEDTTSITENKENINPKTVHLYNITEKKPNIYYQSENEGGSENSNQLNINPAVNRFRKLAPVKGGYVPAGNFIELYKNADPTTIIHEVGHWWLDNIVTLAKHNEEITSDLEEIRKFLKNNGEPFTTEQHEKFARSFEAYVRTGSAKNNRMKKIFEDFKNFLLAIYDNIARLDLDENEIPEIIHLFDRLLTTEHERIKTKVFDKCNQIDEEIQNILANEINEIDRLHNIKKTNVLYGMEQEKHRESVDRYLDMAEKQSGKLPKEVQSAQKRFKNATFAILETATGYKRQFIANPKNWEKVQKIIETTDKITASGGMMNEWLEFYSDAGVNYDSQDIEGDYKLAQQAFDNLVNASWEQENDRVTKFFGKFDFLYYKLQNTKGKDRAAVLDALARTINTDLSFLPDEAMPYIADKLTELENLKIEDNAGNRYFERSKALNAPISIELQAFISNKIHKMKYYDAKEKRIVRFSNVNKLYSKIKNATSVAGAERIVREINRFAIEELRIKQKVILHKEIQKQLKINSKLVKVGNIKRGKFDWATNTVFAELREINRWDKQAVEKYRALCGAGSIVQGEIDAESGTVSNGNMLTAYTNETELLKTQFIEYRATVARDGTERSKIKHLNPTLAKKVLEGILNLKSVGRSTRSEEEFKKAFTRYKLGNDLIERLDNIKDNKVAKFIAGVVGGANKLTSEATLANWESLLNALFGKDIAQKYSLLYDQSNVEIYARNILQKFYKRASEIYGFTENNLLNKIIDYDGINKLVKLMQEYENEIYTFKETTFSTVENKSVETNIEISRSNLIVFYGWALNKQLEQRLINQFCGAENLAKMFEKLSDKDKSFAHLLVDTCDSMYDDINEVFINTVGMSLPKVDNYLPSSTERICSDLDMLQDTLIRSNMPSFNKERVKCSRIKMKALNPFELVMPHINKVSAYVIMSEKLNLYNKIFKDTALKAKMLEVFGKKDGAIIHQRLISALDCMVFPEYCKGLNTGKSIIDTISKNYITAAIGGNLKVMFSQLTSCINYMEYMPVDKWMSGFTDCIAHPKTTIKYMLDNCEYLKARIGGNSQNEVIARITADADRFKNLRQFFTANTRFGDIGAIIFGGKPYVDYLINVQGLSKEEAFKKFVESTLRSQQSGHSSATSVWQKKQVQNPLTRMFFAFNNTTLQYERKFVDSIAQLSKGEISKSQFIKSFLIYKIFNPVMFSSFIGELALLKFISQLFGDDDEVNPFADAGISMGSAILLSGFKGYGYLGFITNAITTLAVKYALGEKYFTNSVPIITDLEKIGKTLFTKGAKGELEFMDYAGMLATLGNYSLGGVPAQRLLNMLGGVYDISQGNTAKGAIRTIGYSSYKADDVFGEDED